MLAYRAKRLLDLSSSRRLTGFPRLAFMLLFATICSEFASAQTLYHLHNIYTGGTFREDRLRTAAPDQASTAVLTVDLKGQGTGDFQLQDSWATDSGVPGITGTIMAGKQVTFSVWMRKTANRGTIYPQAALYVMPTCPGCSAYNDAHEVRH